MQLSHLTGAVQELCSPYRYPTVISRLKRQRKTFACIVCQEGFNICQIDWGDCRPAFLSVTAASLIGNYLKYRNKRRTALAVAIAFGLTTTPELVRLFNEERLPKLPFLGRAIQVRQRAATLFPPASIHDSPCIPACFWCTLILKQELKLFCVL